MVPREITPELLRAATEYPVVTILGPRQSGKTTLARTTFPGKPYYSLEEPDVRSAAELDPRGFLSRIAGGAILDEIQRLPMLLSYLQGMADRPGERGRFILTGSHQPLLHEAISQSLAGRTAMLTLWPFSFRELRHYPSPLSPFERIVRGGYPRLHEERLDPRRFFNAYVQTYVERDVRSMLQLRELSSFQKFLVLLAGRVGQIVNLASLAGDVGVSSPTIRSWLSVLKASYVAFELPAYSANLGRRLVKAPKVYFADTGLAAFLLGIHTAEQAARDPLRGNLWENLVIGEVVRTAANRGIRPELYFYRDAAGHEVDLLIQEGGQTTPVEIKSGETFSPDFLKGIVRLRSRSIPRLRAGAALYGGEERFEVQGVSVFNPTGDDDLWQSLTR